MSKDPTYTLQMKNEPEIFKVNDMRFSSNLIDFLD